MLTACIGFGLGTHLLLDVVTNFGTMLWSPLNYSRPALDWIFIVDLTFTAMALLPQIAAWCYRRNRARFVVPRAGIHALPYLLPIETFSCLSSWQRNRIPDFRSGMSQWQAR